MFSLYILYSSATKAYYIGSTKDLKKRLWEHNNGMVRSTKGKEPWLLVYGESFASRGDAVRRELQLKSWKKRSALEKLIKIGN